MSDSIRSSVTIALATVLLALMAITAVALWWRFDEVHDLGEQRAANLAHILSEHLLRTTTAADTALSQLVLHGQRVGGANAPREVWQPVLASVHSGLAGVGSLSIVDKSGSIVHSTIQPIVGQSRADNYLFRYLSSNPVGTFGVEAPFRSPLSGAMLIPVGRALRTADGSFDGMVVATLEPERLRSFYRSVDVGSGGVVRVIHPTGALLFREPSTQDPLGRPAPDLGELPMSGTPQMPAIRRGPIELDGDYHVTAYRTTSGMPLVVAISLARTDLLRPWWREAMAALGFFAIVSATLWFAGRSVAREISAADAAAVARDQARSRLEASRAQFQAVMDNSPVIVSVKDMSGRFLFVNRGFEHQYGMPAADVTGTSIDNRFPADHIQAGVAMDQEVIATKRTIQREITLGSATAPRTFLVLKFPILDGEGAIQAVGSITADITDRKVNEQQLAHAQRMEAVGQLTGGIAHDFNNLLTVIIGNCEALVHSLQEQPGLQKIAEAILTTSERGSQLTRRLLAFARRQILTPQPTDVNALLADMERLLVRTLGEHIAIQFALSPGLWTATVDPAQLDNAILNLAVNARDAMAKGGRLVIETANVELDEAYAEANAEVEPGQYVMVSVADTGSGMTPEVMAHAFEPFFSTKEVGRGTGLGLSQVYGFVKQSGGHVKIYSEIGHGTIVRLYLRRSTSDAVRAMRTDDNGAIPPGIERILLVEDDSMVRAQTQLQLEGLGYRVTADPGPNEAIARVQAGFEFDLLLTDVMMPGLNGEQLAVRLREMRPELKVLFLSGYPQSTISGSMGTSIAPELLLGKPYRLRDLASKVRFALDGRTGPVNGTDGRG